MCTGIGMTATDGTVVCVRALEFAVDLEPGASWYRVASLVRASPLVAVALSMGGAEPFEPLCRMSERRRA